MVRLNRPLQILYPIEVSESAPELLQNLQSQVEWQTSIQRHVIPRHAAALDAAWKIREMTNQRNDQ